MQTQTDQDYYTGRQAELVCEFDEQAECWRLVLARRYGGKFAEEALDASREAFQELVPKIPYIGGDENHLTNSLICATQCLAVYQAMKRYERTAAVTGKVLYDAILTRPRSFPGSNSSAAPMTPEQLMECRRQRAAMSQQRRYAEDYVYTFVPGSGVEFDYGYDFSECAAQKFYRTQEAEDFLPYYCYLDFAESQVLGLGLQRSMTLSESHDHCNPRFKRGRGTVLEWPPRFKG